MFLNTIVAFSVTRKATKLQIVCERSIFLNIFSASTDEEITPITLNSTPSNAINIERALQLIFVRNILPSHGRCAEMRRLSPSYTAAFVTWELSTKKEKFYKKYLYY